MFRSMTPRTLLLLAAAGVACFVTALYAVSLVMQAKLPNDLGTATALPSVTKEAAAPLVSNNGASGRLSDLVPQGHWNAAVSSAPTFEEALAKKLDQPHALKNEAVLVFKTPQAYQAFLNRAAAEGLKIKGKSDALNMVRVGYDGVGALANDLAAHPQDVQQVGANFPVTPTPLMKRDQPTGQGDVPFGDQTLATIGAGANVDRSQWGNGVTVAVVDSGVADHPTFTAGQVTHIDLVNDGQPFDGHGTAMASLIAGSAPGAEGVSPAAKILDVRVSDATGTSNSFLLAEGITTAVQNGAQVINISMGSFGDAPAVAEAVQSALSRGVVVVASAGNEDLTTLDWPAAYPGVISVSGVDASGHIAYFSNAGQPTLSAPAVGIPSAFAVNGQPYLAQGDGTSQAAALVSGAAAMVTSTGGNVVKTLTQSATTANAPATQVGAGVLSLSTVRR